MPSRRRPGLAFAFVFAFACAFVCAFACACVGGCGGGSAGAPRVFDEQNVSGCGEGWQDAYLDDASPPAGDTTCIDTGPLAADPACVATLPVDGTVVDFEEGFERADVSGTLEGEAFTSDAGGVMHGSATSCSATGYAIDADDAVLATNVAPMIFGHGALIQPRLAAVSRATRQRALDLLGRAVVDDKGLVAGIVLDCDGQPLANAQLIVRDETCAVPLGAFVAYFVEHRPVGVQPLTSEDGLFLFADVDPGHYVVEAWGKRGATSLLLGSVVVDVTAGGVTLTTVAVGRDDGAPPPVSCFGCG